MKGKDIDNLENILLDLEDVENGAMISLSQEEINSLESILETLKSSISEDKIREKIDKYRKKIEKLHSQELWNEPEDTIKDFKYNHYLEAYKELLEENK